MKLHKRDVPMATSAFSRSNILFLLEREKPIFESGEFVTCGDGFSKTIAISNKSFGDELTCIECYVLLNEGRLFYDCVCGAYNFRSSTEEEKQDLLEALHKDNKDWHANRKELVQYRWKPKDGQKYWIISYGETSSDIWNSDNCDIERYKSGNVFATENEAQKYCDKIMKILKERKL